MRELAEELTWWGETDVPVHSDLSRYSGEVERLRQANDQPRPQTEAERVAAMYQETATRVAREIFDPVTSAIASTTLSHHSDADRQIEGWYSADYGGSGSLPSWSIPTLRSPWLTAFIGVVHRTQPVTDLTKLKVRVLIATMMADGTQKNHADITEEFVLGSIQLDRIIRDVQTEVMDALPAIISDFLTTCKESGIPR
jgi:hypothetical protein